MTRDLARLLRPRHVAVFGGGAWGANVVEQCRRMGFEGPVWPVHPARDEIGGMRCFRTVADLPEAPDASFVAVNREATVGIVRELALRGAGGAVCFASGFRESVGEIGGGADLEAALVEAAGRMPVLGPNCYGLLNYLDGAALWPDQHGGARVERGVSLVTQSSNLLINLTMQRRGLPVAYAVAAGNQAQTGLEEIGTALLEDPRVTAVGLHIEGVRDARAFEAMAARARALGKPVVALKVGRSEEARAATVSHTASLAGSDAASRAFLARLGIGVAETVPEFLETLKLLHVHGPLAGTALASMSCSGGEASLIADAAVRQGVNFRPLSAEERARVKATLSGMVTVANPLDYHTFIWGDEERLAATFGAMLACPFDLALLILDFPREDRCSAASWEPTVRAIARAAHETGTPVAVTASMPENLPEARAAELMALGLAPMLGFDETLAAVRIAAAIGAAQAAPEPEPLLAAPPRAEGAETFLLDERLAKVSLAAHGVPVPAGRFAADREEAVRVADALGYPVALKALGVAHKTERGAVRLGLGDAGAVRSAAESMAAPDGYLIERMVEGTVAELLVGVTREAPYGFALTLGAGGVLTEVLSDTVTLMMPATPAEIRAALSFLRVAPILTGYRGKPAADIDRVVEAVMALQTFVAAEAARLEELDINPLMAGPIGAVAADALIRLRDGPATAGEAPRSPEEGPAQER